MDWTTTASKSIFYCSASSCVPFVPPSYHTSLLLLFFKWNIFFLHAGAISSRKEAMSPLTVQTKNEREGHAGCSIWLVRRQHAVVKQVSVFILPKSFLGGFPLLPLWAEVLNSGLPPGPQVLRVIKNK